MVGLFVVSIWVASCERLDWILRLMFPLIQSSTNLDQSLTPFKYAV